jgi:hypothetical protein
LNKITFPGKGKKRKSVFRLQIFWKMGNELDGIEKNQI